MPCLVLSRKIDQSIVVGSDVFIKIVEITGDKVRLAIEAPAEVALHRLEIYREILDRDGVVTPGGRGRDRPAAVAGGAVPRGPMPVGRREIPTIERTRMDRVGPPGRGSYGYPTDLDGEGGGE